MTRQLEPRKIAPNFMRVKAAILAAIASAGLMLTAIQAAEAGGRHHNYRGYHGGFYVGNGAAVAGVIGLAAGAIVGSALAAPRYYGGPVYYAPRRYAYPSRVYVAPRPRYRAPVYAPPVRYGAAAFTPEWIAYCARKYKSFNPRTGTYLAYSGKVRMCR